jgi:tRNA A-37 threonylcarbamoyl transferase component Bud32
VIERLTRFAVADSTLTGVEYEYWLALDEARGLEVWLQVAESRGVVASGVHLAGVVSSLRRLNHPAVPAVLDFGEIEVVVEDDGEGPEDDIVVTVGYVVLEPVEAESLATVLLRGALTEAEILAVLVAIADVLKVLHEVELVHGHLSAYSFLLSDSDVLLVDLAAALALEVASGSELTPAADVYALAWLACVAFAGVEAVEAEFGVGFDAGSSPESAAAPQLLTFDLIERRRAWAEANLVATYGVSAELALLLIAALGEASSRPAVGEIAAALRVREDVAGTRAGVVAGAGLAAAAAGVAAVLAAEEVVAAARAAEAAEVIEAVEVAEAESAAAAEVFGGGEIVESAELLEVGEALEVGGVAGSTGSKTPAYVGAGIGVGMGIGAEALSVETSGGSGRAGGTATAVASVPVISTSSPAGRHGSPPRRPRSAFYVALGIVVLIVGGVAWGCAASTSSNTASPAAPLGSQTGGQASGGSSTSTSSAGASPSPTVGQSAGAGVTPSATVVASPSGGATASAGAQVSSTPGSGFGYTATPLSTIPASPSQAVQQLQQTVSAAESGGQIPRQAQGPLNQAISTLRQEIGSGSSVQQGINELRGALNTSGVPSGFVSQVSEYLPYLIARYGS